MSADNFMEMAARLFPNHTYITGEFRPGEDSIKPFDGENLQLIIDGDANDPNSNIGLAIGNSWIRNCFYNEEDFIVGLPPELMYPLDYLAKLALEKFAASPISTFNEVVEYATLLQFAHVNYSGDSSFINLVCEEAKNATIN